MKIGNFAVNQKYNYNIKNNNNNIIKDNILNNKLNNIHYMKIIFIFFYNIIVIDQLMPFFIYYNITKLASF